MFILFRIFLPLQYNVHLPDAIILSHFMHLVHRFPSVLNKMKKTTISL